MFCESKSITVYVSGTIRKIHILLFSHLMIREILENSVKIGKINIRRVGGRIGEIMFGGLRL